jgi:hypothetical protein
MGEGACSPHYTIFPSEAISIRSHFRPESFSAEVISIRTKPFPAEASHFRPESFPAEVISSRSHSSAAVIFGRSQFRPNTEVISIRSHFRPKSFSAGRSHYRPESLPAEVIIGRSHFQQEPFFSRTYFRPESFSAEVISSGAGNFRPKSLPTKAIFSRSHFEPHKKAIRTLLYARPHLAAGALGKGPGWAASGIRRCGCFLVPLFVFWVVGGAVCSHSLVYVVALCLHRGTNGVNSMRSAAIPGYTVHMKIRYHELCIVHLAAVKKGGGEPPSGLSLS